jgi:WD repeat-containing protein 21A
MSPRSIHDIWTSHLSGRTLLVGASKGAAIMQDVNLGEISKLHTGSDVFAVWQDQHGLDQGLAYVGARNGKVTRFDLRTRASAIAGHPLLSEMGGAPVTSLRTLRGSELLVARMDGSVRISSWSFPFSLSHHE